MHEDIEMHVQKQFTNSTGDSGGPLVGKANLLLTLLGIISLPTYGLTERTKCNTATSLPVIFTNVSKYGKWIDQKTGTGTYNFLLFIIRRNYYLLVINIFLCQSNIITFLQIFCHVMFLSIGQILL